MEEKKIAEIASKLSQMAPLFFKKVIRPFEQQIKPLLSPLQFHSLIMLYEKEVDTMSGLSNEIKISKQQLTPIVDKLIKDGYVQREHDEYDRRVVRISITPQGCAVVENQRNEISQVTKNKLISLDDNDLLSLDDALTSLFDVINKIH